MRQQLLNGYILHHRAYQEKRAIYRFFSYEFGMVHGAGVRGMPLFSPLHLQATGQNSLKNFTQIALGFGATFPHQASVIQPILSVGKIEYALLYLNEVLCRLLPLENPCPDLWQVYQATLQGLQTLKSCDSAQQMTLLRLYLRRFERALFLELGVSIDFRSDVLGASIEPDCRYQFLPDAGFVPLSSADKANLKDQKIYAGCELIMMQNLTGDYALMNCLHKVNDLHRSLMDYLLDYKPLNSRKLWQQSQRYCA